jgi:uncharacterized repeat protein (TIGR01451 family)
VRTPLLVTLLVLTLTLGQLHPSAAVIGPVADVSISASAWPQAVPTGGTFDITIRVGNAGPFDAKNVAVRIAVPENTTFVSWINASRSRDDVPVSTPAPGGTGTVNACIATLETPATPASNKTLIFVLSVRVDPNVPQGQAITATATVPGVRTDDPLWCPPTTYDPGPQNNTATATVSVSGPADLWVSASATPDPVTAGGDLTYALDITNAGPGDAQNVTLSDWFAPITTLVSFSQVSGPAFTLQTTGTGGENKVTASIAGLAAGATAHFTLVVNVPGTVPNGSTMDNSVAASSGTGDPDPSNDSVTVRTPVVAGP